MKLKVIQGKIALSSVRLIRRQSGMIVLFVDCSSKYYNIDSICGDGDNEKTTEINLWLKSNKRTLYTTKNKNLTELVINGLRGDWQIYHPESCRYGFEIVLVKRPTNELSVILYPL